MIIREVFLDVFRPYYTLKDLGSVMFKWAALVMLLVAFVVAASNSGQGMEPILQAILTVQRCVRVAQCGLVLFLVVFSRYVGVSWRQKSFGIALGLGAAAGVELGTYALYVGGMMSQVSLHVANLVAYNLTIMVWFGYAVLKSQPQTREVDLFTSHRWERGLTDLHNPAHGASLIPMFESKIQAIMTDFLVVGVISSVRKILLVGAESSLGGEKGLDFIREAIGVVISIAGILLLIGGLVALRRFYGESQEPRAIDGDAA